MTRRQQARAIMWAAAACYTLLPSAGFGQDNAVCEPSIVEPIGSGIQWISFNFKGPARIDLPEGEVRVLRVPADTEMIAELDGVRATARSGTAQELAVAVDVGVSPRVDKPRDTTLPWMIRVDVVEADYDGSGLAPSAVQGLEAALLNVEVWLNEWTSAPLQGSQKQQLQSQGTLEFELDAVAIAEPGLTPADAPLTLVALDRPERPRSLYEHAAALRDRQETFKKLTSAVAKLEGDTTKALEAAQEAERLLAAIDGSDLVEDLLAAETLSATGVALAAKIVESDTRLAALMVRRREALRESQGIRLFVDAEAEAVRHTPATGFFPLQHIIRSTARTREALEEEYRERFRRPDPAIPTLQAMRELMTRDPRMIRLVERQQRLTRYRAEERALVAEEDRAIGAIDAEIAALRAEIAELGGRNRVLRDQYRSSFSDLGPRLAALAKALAISPQDTPSGVDPTARNSYRSALDWMARQRSFQQSAVNRQWEAYGALYEHLADADRRLAILVESLFDQRRSAALAACQALASFSNADHYGDLLAGLRHYVAVMRHMPILVMAPTSKHFEMTLSHDVEDEVTRKVLRDNVTAFMSYLQKDAGINHKVLLGANYYNKVMKRIDMGASLVALTNDWNNDDPVVVFRFLELLEKSLPGGVNPGIKAVIYVGAKAGIAVTEAGNRIADRMMLEALAAIRERGRADAPDRRLYSVEDIKRDQFYKNYAWWTSDTDVERVATFFQAQYIFRLLRED